MEHMEHKNFENQKAELFLKQQPILEEIYKKGFSDYANSIKNIAEAFKSHDCCMRCMDEGTPGGFHSAGSGILRNKEEVISAFKTAGVKKITSHDGCGAAGLYAKAHNFDLSKADEYGKKFAKEIAEELGLPYEHISSEKMNRPKEFHISRVAYYDGTGKFDYDSVKELPAGFIISRGIQQAGDSVAEAKVAFNIATGDHGFGDKINVGNPFVFVVIGKTTEEAGRLTLELSGLSNEKARIEKFVVPVN
jgi:hypothetical protein